MEIFENKANLKLLHYDVLYFYYDLIKWSYEIIWKNKNTDKKII